MFFIEITITVIYNKTNYIGNEENDYYKRFRTRVEYYKRFGT